MATRMAIRLATFKKKRDEVRRLTLTATKTSSTSYAAVTAFSPFLFPSQNLKRKFPTAATNSKDLEADLSFARQTYSRNSKSGINNGVSRPNNGSKGAGKELIDEDGWMLVTRRRRVAKPKLNQVNSVNKSNPKLKGHHANLFIPGKCFRCLQKGHKSMNCKNQRRCFNCQGTDHLFKNCNSLSSSNVINSPIEKRNKFMHGNNGKEEEGFQDKETNRQPYGYMKGKMESTHNHPSRHYIHKLKNMATPPNWQNMQMQDSANIQNRVNELRVYLPPREEMAEENQFLVRSAIVFAGPHYNDCRIPQRLAYALGRFFGIPHQNFRISEIDPSIGDFVAVFPNSIMRDDAVRMGVFVLDCDVEVQLVEWTDELGMLHEPTMHRARIRLHGVPLQYWNKEDLSDLVAGFGYLVRVAPFFDNGNHEVLRILVACHDPENIPKKYSTD